MKTIAANWKLNGSVALVESMGMALKNWAKTDPYTKAVICPPYPYLTMLNQQLVDTEIHLGAQDCHSKISGAYTGDVSAEMLVEMGCAYVILGHSERRYHYKESDKQVAEKVQAAVEAGLTPIICIGESQAQREMGNAVEVVTEQAKKSLPTALNYEIILAYEPIWAIGSGQIPSMDDISEMHGALKLAMKEHGYAQVDVLYGGSVKASNAGEILALTEVDGALVGGASLKEDEFLGILQAAEKN